MATASQLAARRRVYADAEKWQLLIDRGGIVATWHGPYCWDGACSWVWVGELGYEPDIYGSDERAVVISKRPFDGEGC